MLRTELQQALSEVLLGLDQSGMFKLFESEQMRTKSPDERVKIAVLEIFKQYLQVYERFGNTERKIMEILKLDVLNKVDLWTMLMGDEGFRHGKAHDIYLNLLFTKRNLPKILDLLERDTDRIPRESESSKEEAGDLAQLTAIVIEEKEFSTPERLILMLEALEGLYQASAQVLKCDISSLSVLSCDSGSDKSFDFLGVAKVIQCVKEIILSFWDRVVYFREDKTEKQLDLIANSLPILKTISDMKTRREIEPESAELLKKQVIESVRKFANAGTTIPEIEKFTTFNPRQLMKPERKLLVAAAQSTQEEEPKKPSTQPPGEIDDPEFQEYMEQMSADFLRRRNEAKKDREDPPDQTEDR